MNQTRDCHCHTSPKPKSSNNKEEIKSGKSQ